MQAYQKKCLEKKKPPWEGTTGDHTHEMKKKTKLHATRDKTKKEKKNKTSNMIWSSIEQKQINVQQWGT